MSQTKQALANVPQEYETYAQTASLVFFPDGERAIHVSKCELATLVQLQDRWKRIGSLMMAACTATVSSDGKWIVCGCSDGKLRVLDVESQTLSVETNDYHARKVTALDVQRTHCQRAAGPLNLSGHHGNLKVSFVRFSRCGNHLACCVNTLNPPRQHGTVYILDILENQLTQRVVVTFNSCVTTVVWSDATNGQQQILAGLEESIAVIDPLHGDLNLTRKPIPGFRALSKNRKFIVSGTWQDGVRFWDASTFAEIGPILPSCLPLALSPNNTLVSVSRNDHGLSNWNLSDMLPRYYIIDNDDTSFAPMMTATSASQALECEATEAFNTLLSKVQLSTKPEAHRQYQLYANPVQRREAEAIISEVLKLRPPALIDTRTGHLCHKSLQVLTLEVNPSYRNLLSSIGDQDRFRKGVETFFEYVMFSHKWDENCREPLFHDIYGKSIYRDLERSPTNDKLHNFCQMARKTGHRWAWSDTCCINRTDPSVLNKAIISMYRWYKESAVTLAFLSSVVPPSKRGDLRDDIWMTRVWTLQELLAPRVVRFYDSEWNPYLNDLHHDHRDSPVINAELASAIPVTPQTISAFHPAGLGVREKLRLASTRSAKEEEDIAYSLFGIFASDLIPNYGEGKDALARLLEEIVHRSGDVTVLAWTGSSSRFNSCLPAKITVYKEPPHTVSLSDVNKLRTRVVELRSLLQRETAMAIYGQVVNLPKASFANRCLHLPCITFAVDGLTVVTSGPEWRVYRAGVSVLGDVKIKTTDLLPLREPHTLLLVHPWINDILHVPASTALDDYTRALWLIAHLGLKFTALLLQRQSYHGYKRVAADHEIAVQLPRSTSVHDILTQVADVWDSHIGML